MWVDDYILLHLKCQNSPISDKRDVPFISRRHIRLLIQNACEIFEKEPALLDLEGKFVIIGDLHGQLFDLYRVFQTYKPTDERYKYLFLGDLIDRGPFSIEVISLIFALKVRYPDRFYVIRGNHEFQNVALLGGFFTDIEQLYPNSNVFDAFCTTFSHLPLAAILNTRTFCCHGGLSPLFTSVQILRQITKPINDCPIMSGLMWSDPSDAVSGFGSSPRGSGFLFGKDVFDSFIESNDFDYMIRGHECVQEGVKFSFEDKLITVFSASNYCGVSNRGGVLVVDPKDKPRPRFFEPMSMICRNHTMLIKLQTGSPSFNSDGIPTLSDIVIPVLKSRSKKGNLQLGKRTQRARSFHI